MRLKVELLIVTYAALAGLRIAESVDQIISGWIKCLVDLLRGSPSPTTSWASWRAEDKKLRLFFSGVCIIMCLLKWARPGYSINSCTKKISEKIAVISLIDS